MLANDTDPDPRTDVVGCSRVADSHGTLTLDPSGSFVYVPQFGFNGTDSFTYTGERRTAQLEPRDGDHLRERLPVQHLA